MIKRISQHAAFTLTEVAIVLGVLGTVLIGIWAAFNSINENNQANRTYAILTEIVNNIRTTYNNQVPYNMPTNASGNRFITNQLNTLGVFPPDLTFVDTGNPANDRANTPWGGFIQVSLVSPAGLGGIGPGFIVGVFQLSVAQCIRLATNFVQNLDNRNVWLRLNSAPDFNPNQNPPDEATIAQKCNESPQAQVGVGYVF